MTTEQKVKKITQDNKLTISQKYYCLNELVDVLDVSELFKFIRILKKSDPNYRGPVSYANMKINYLTR